RKGGPSDATVDILSRQLQRREAQTTWRRVEADRKLTDITAELLDCLLSASSSSRSVSLKEAS
ncbi:MAG: aminoglycoside phosphotransferase, partial [Mesorhizobium sp.]